MVLGFEPLFNYRSDLGPLIKLLFNIWSGAMFTTRAQMSEILQYAQEPGVKYFVNDVS